MALHRDIYWVGRQWAVTGYGMQAVDPKLKGQFDIEASRLWEDDLSESLNAGAWLNSEDFAKALAVARARYPQPPPKIPDPPREAAAGLTSSLDASPTSSVASSMAASLVSSSALGSNGGAPMEPLKPPVPRFAMRIEHWPAKFLRPWRARLRR